MSSVKCTVVVVGDALVGKSSLIKRLISDEFSQVGDIICIILTVFSSSQWVFSPLIFLTEIWKKVTVKQMLLPNLPLLNFFGKLNIPANFWVIRGPPASDDWKIYTQGEWFPQSFSQSRMNGKLRFPNICLIFIIVQLFWLLETILSNSAFTSTWFLVTIWEWKINFYPEGTTQEDLTFCLFLFVVLFILAVPLITLLCTKVQKKFKIEWSNLDYITSRSSAWSRTGWSRGRYFEMVVSTFKWWLI